MEIKYILIYNEYDCYNNRWISGKIEYFSCLEPAWEEFQTIKYGENKNLFNSVKMFEVKEIKNARLVWKA
jgi:hypothetical protein